MATATEASQQAHRSAMDPKRLVVIFYLIAGIVLALFLEHVLGLLWAKAGWADHEIIERVRERPLVAVGIALAAGYLVGRVFSRWG